MKNIIKALGDFLVSHTKVPTKQKIFFVQELSIMIKTGIPLSVGIKTLRDETKNRKLKKILNDLYETVQKGELLSNGLEKYKKDFGEMFVNVVRGGEQSGRLEDVLAQLYIHLKKDNAIVSKVRGAMIYPSVVIVGMIGVGILMMVYVMPNLIGVFEELQVELPLATRLLIAISKTITTYGLFFIIGGILCIGLFMRLITWPMGKRVFHIILLKLPVASTIIKKINIARFCRTFSSLLKTDIAIIDTFEITSKVLGNQMFREALNDAKEKVRKGQRVEVALRPHSDLFPPVILQMISVGEETGSLDKILEQTAEFYEEDVDQTMTNFPALIEPILILILGAAVGTMAVAVIMPLYSLSQQV